jgi:hypothetical protein
MPKYELTTLEGYEKKELPYFNEWINALESGEYKQGRGMLVCVTTGAYCCLGVLSKIQGRLDPNTSDEDHPNVETYHSAGLTMSNPCYQQLSHLGAFPSDVSVRVIAHGRVHNLADCNDAKLTFKQIAEIIKQVWKPINTT